MSVLIYEEKKSYIDHDRLFKELIQTFFQSFIEGFFPEEAADIDFSTVTFLEQEIFTDIVKGERRQIDILAEVKMKQKEQIILIHVEPQSSLQHEFNERMFIYYSRLYEKYRMPILPIAVFSYDDSRFVDDTFTIELPTVRILSFHYLQLHLIKKSWREFIKEDNPAVAALLSKMGYTEKERIQVKFEFLRMISRMKLDPAKMQLMYGFFETYLQLNEEEEQIMREKVDELPKEESDLVSQLPNSYFDRGMKEGLEQGIEQGQAELVHTMFSNGLTARDIEQATNLSVERIKQLLKK
ncbi:MAG TPA: transposase [Bacillota bacterium]|nr:transposase [Bacillota bacterium]